VHDDEGANAERHVSATKPSPQINSIRRTDDIVRRDKHLRRVERAIGAPDRTRAARPTHQHRVDAAPPRETAPSEKFGGADVSRETPGEGADEPGEPPPESPAVPRGPPAAAVERDGADKPGQAPFEHDPADVRPEPPLEPPPDATTKETSTGDAIGASAEATTNCARTRRCPSPRARGGPWRRCDGRHQPARPKKEWTSVLRMTNGRERRNCARGSTADTTGADTMSDWSSPKGPDRVRVERDRVPLDDAPGMVPRPSQPPQPRVLVGDRVHVLHSHAVERHVVEAVSRRAYRRAASCRARGARSPSARAGIDEAADGWAARGRCH